MPRESRPIEQPNLVAVEGTDDRVFLEAYLKFRGIEIGWQVMDMGSKDSLESFLVERLPALPGFERLSLLAVILDADLDCAMSRERAFALLQIFSKARKIDTLLFLFPDNQNPGMLETLLCNYWKRNESRFTCAQGYMDCLPMHGLDVKRKLAKRISQVFLASLPWRKDRVHSIHFAISEGEYQFDFSDPVFDPLNQFFDGILAASRVSEA